MAASWKKRVGRFTVYSRGSRFWLYYRQGTTGRDRVTARMDSTGSSVGNRDRRRPAGRSA